jgi:hypothetical protein
MTFLNVATLTTYALPLWARILVGIILLASIVTLVLVRRGVLSDKIGHKVREYSIVVLGAMAATVLRGASESGVQQIQRALEWVMRKLGLQVTQLLIAFIVTGFGIGAYKFKSFNQKWYGIVEVVVGFLSAVFVAGTLTPGTLELAKWATLGGAAYVVQRGLGNYFDGKKPGAPGNPA